MIDVIYPLLAMILVSVSAMTGAFVSLFTKLEMESYKNVLEKTLNILGIALFLAVAAAGFVIKCPITVIVAIAALIGFLALKNKNPVFGWAVLGAVLGFLFAINMNTAYMLSIFFVVHNFVYATVLNIPYVLKKKKFMKTRLTEQAVFFVNSVAVYFIVMPFF